MSITSGTEILGGGAGYGFGGGFNSISPIGIVGLNTLFGRDGFGNDGFNGHNGSTPGTTVLEQNVSDLRKDVADNGKELHVLGNEISGMFATQNLAFSGDFRNLDNKICDTEKLIAQQGYNLSLQGFQNTQAIQTQMNNFQHSVDNQFCAVKSQIAEDGDRTRNLITQNLIDDLRHQLEAERRGRDNREIEINVNQSNNQIQGQIQAQAQLQNQYLTSLLGNISDQVNKATNSVVNLGTMVGNGQSATQNNTKVNS